MMNYYVRVSDDTDGGCDNSDDNSDAGGEFIIIDSLVPSPSFLALECAGSKKVGPGIHCLHMRYKNLMNLIIKSSHDANCMSHINTLVVITVKSAMLTKSPLSFIDFNTVQSSTSTAKAEYLNRVSSKAEKVLN